MADENATVAEAPAKLTSKSIVLIGNGGYDKLKIQQLDRPTPAAGEVLVNVKASGLNFAELMCRQGMYDRCPKLPTVLGLEAAGVVTEVGEGVEKFKGGERVVCVRNFGLWTEYAAVDAAMTFVIPDEMTYAEAAAFPVTYVTAHVILFNFGNLRPDQSVLVHMAAGGVGTAATQLCQTVENVTVFGTASEAKHERIKKNGVTHPIDYRTKDYAAEVRKISPEGVDIVLDPLSGDDSVKGYNLVKPLGKIVHYGAANMLSGPSKNYLQMIKTWWNAKTVNPLQLMTANKAICGVHIGYMVDTAEPLLKILTELLEMYKKGSIKPLIDSEWAFEDIDLAMAKMHDRLNVGKVILSTEKAPETRPEPEKKKEKKRRDSKREKKDKKEEKKDEKKEEKTEENNEVSKEEVKEAKEETKEKEDDKEEVVAKPAEETPAEEKKAPDVEEKEKE